MAADVVKYIVYNENLLLMVDMELSELTERVKELIRKKSRRKRKK